MLALYGTFSALVCVQAVRYLFFRLKEEADAKALLAEMRSNRAKYQKSTLLDDLPFLMSEEKVSEESKAEQTTLV